MIGILALLFLALSVSVLAGLSTITGTIQKPTNGQSFNTRSNINFTVIPYEWNTTGTFNIANVTLYTSNISGGGVWIANTTQSGVLNATSLSWLMNFSADGNFTFNFYIVSNDTLTGTVNDSWASPTANYTITVDTTKPSLTITAPSNQTYTTVQTTLNATISDTNLAYCWYSTNAGATNTTLTCGTNATGLTSAQGTNKWYFYANDSSGNLNQSSITFYVDSTGQSVTLGTPANGNNSFHEGESVIFSFTPTDTNTLSNCSLYIDGSLSQTLTSITDSASNSFSSWTSTPGDHGWYVSCVDNYANTGNSSAYSIGIMKLVGGGGGSSTYATTTTLKKASQPKTLAIAGSSGTGEGMGGWTIFWLSIAGIAALVILYYFGAVLVKIATPVLMFLFTNIIGWVILAIIALAIFLWWVF